ncbi:hypothetical protein CLOM_g22092, partial [Closterium sp. NIES-68]
LSNSSSSSSSSGTEHQQQRKLHVTAAMVRATEYRITMPVSLEEYRIGQTYMRSRMQMENTRGSEGVEVRASHPFADDRMGHGHFAHVVYHFHSKAPAWLRALAPHGALCLEEQNWNAYPHSKTGMLSHALSLWLSGAMQPSLPSNPSLPYLSFLLPFMPPHPCLCSVMCQLLTWPPSYAICHCLAMTRCRFAMQHQSSSSLALTQSPLPLSLLPFPCPCQCPYFTKFTITIESMHVADRGDSENALGLDEAQLKQRKVERLDIASHDRDMWSRLIAKSGIDPSKVTLTKTNRGPLTPGWQSTCEPVMTAYKMVTVDAPYWGFGKRLELLVLAGERALFLEAHRKCFGWMDEWCELTMEDVRRIEKENIEAMRKNLALNNKVAPDEFNEDELRPEVDGSLDDADSSGTELADSPKGKGKAAEGKEIAV